jgi:hypothetical protein
MEKVIQRVTFEEADRLDLEFWASKTTAEKIAALNATSNAISWRSADQKSSPTSTANQKVK